MNPAEIVSFPYEPNMRRVRIDRDLEVRVSISGI